MDNTLTTNTQGVAIKPIPYPLNEGTATRLSVLVLNFATDATTATTYWQLLTEEGKVLAQDNYTLTEEQFLTWGVDNSVVNEYVAEYLGVVIL
jgi:predicted secreted protein